MPVTKHKLDIIDVRANDTMACSESTKVCLKFTIVFLNIPIIIIGAVSLGVGVWVIVDDTSFFDLAASVLDLQVLGQDVLRQGAVVMITAGAAMIILAGLGVVGALAMSSCLLVFYVVALIMLLTLEVAVIILGIVFKSEWEKKADSLVTSRLMSQYGNEDDATRGPFTRTVNALQRKLHCCGWEGGADYSNVDRAHWNTTLGKGQQRTVPDTCCPTAPNATWAQECAASPFNSTYYSAQGCRAMIETEFKTYQWVVIGVTIGVLAFQLLVIIMALVLVVHNVNNKYDMS